ncbi:helix-turn-helix domain-containing protein [Kitasatospora sp. NPDC085895]|uniref:helix-turn-helix domain-containing protein n=1 Tax=Kitasatospora sp. NPDC085895 TaxID=3155057 RepID=UPI00344E1251
MSGEHDEREAALTELRRQMENRRLHKGLSKVVLGDRAGLGRTTVHLALQAGGPVPSPSTVAALARVLGLPVEPLLALQGAAAGKAGPAPSREKMLGKPIGDWDPHDLEVHPAGANIAAAGTSARLMRVLSRYVPRAHDQVMAEVVCEAAEGRSQMLVLVGTSSTGKTRACWEAVQPLAARGWRLWHPYHPEEHQAVLADLERVAPRTVVWLNEAQHYLGAPRVGEDIASALHTLLTEPGRGPILVLGSLWPDYARAYTQLQAFGGTDRHLRVRKLLAGRTLTVPETFGPQELRTAQAFAGDGDQLLADALTRAGGDGRVAQDLAGAPELLRFYEQGSPAVRALLEAAMDARRLGVGLHLPQSFLTDAAADYVADVDKDQLTGDWAGAAYEDLARPVHGKQAPLRRIPDEPAPGEALDSVLRLADILEQHGRGIRRRLCPPASFWRAAHAHLTRPDDLYALTDAAARRHRLLWAHCLRQKAADVGHPSALAEMARRSEWVGDQEGADTFLRKAAQTDDTKTLISLGSMRREIGDQEGAEALYRKAADAGDTEAMVLLAWLREEADDRDAAETLLQKAADAGGTFGMDDLAARRESAGDLAGAEALYRRAADAGSTHALMSLISMREKAGDREGAQDLLRRAADNSDARTLTSLGDALHVRGMQDAEALYRRAADAGDLLALYRLATIREEEEDRDGAEALLRQAADAGDGGAMARLAKNRELSGDWESAEALYRQAGDAGYILSLTYLAHIRQKAGDQEGTDALYREAADAGHCFDYTDQRWRYGLEPDGSPTPWP